MLFLSAAAEAAPSTQTLSFSARLKNSTGSVVADGYYNISFRLYDQASAGSPLWTETYHDSNGPAAGQDNRLKVVNGYFSVKLGSLQAFDNVDWTGDLWMTMNIGGTEQVANSANIAWDGEMNPRIQLSAVPYAMNANLLGGKSADEFLQVGSSTQDASSEASIAINKTGGGDLIQLQSSGTDAFTLHNTGSMTLGSASSQSISVADSTSGAGQSLTLAAGSSTTGDSDGGDLVLQAGNGSGTGADGDIIVASNLSVGAGQTITMVGGATSLRPAAPEPGTIYFDNETQELLVYADGKWQTLNNGSSDGKTASKIVAASNSPEAIKASADYVADGIADQAEINDALTAASGGNVYLAEGIYSIDSTILIPNNTTLRGSGKATEIHFASLGGGDNMIEATGSNRTGQSVRDLSLNRRDDLNPTGIYTGISFSNIGSTDSLGAVNRQGATISNVALFGFKTGINISSTSDTRITNNYLQANGSGIVIGSNSYSNNITDNTITNASESAPAVGLAGNNNTVSNNTITNYGVGVVAYFSSHNRIKDNYITNASQYGINLYEETADTVVSGNYIYESGGTTRNNAIFIDAAYDNNQIIGNYIYDSQHTTSNDALYIDAGDTYIADNSLNGGSINDSGSGTTYANQLDANDKLINRSSGGFGVQDGSGNDALEVDGTTGSVNIAGTLDTTTATGLDIGTGNATSINLGNNTKVQSKTDNLTAFQVQNSADAAVLTVSTSGGNTLTLGSGSGGIGHVGTIAAGVSNETTTTVTTSVDRNVGVGQTAIGSLTTINRPGAILLVTDSKGNTYTVDSQSTNDTNVDLYIFSGHITTALTKDDTLTFTLANIFSNTRWAWNVEAFDNIVATDRVDAVASQPGEFSANMSSGVTPATTDTNELVYGGFAYTDGGSPRTMTPGPGFSSSPPQTSGTADTNRANFVQWKYVTETGPQTSTATSSASASWAAGVVTYRTSGERGIAGSIGLSGGNGFTGSLNTSGLTANRTYTLPDEDGVICIQDSSDCGFIQADDAVALRADTNSANAFSVQSADGLRQLGVDTMNNQVTIGSNDNVGTLLVIDTKTGAGDPTGTNGAMYYNAAAGKFRCYQAGDWTDCITPLPVSAVVETETEHDDTNSIDVNDLAFTLSPNTKYYYKFIIRHDVTADGAGNRAGVGFGVTAPANAVANHWCVNTAPIVMAEVQNHWGSYCGVGDADTTTQNQGAGDDTANFSSTMEGYIETGATGGDLQLRMKSSRSTPAADPTHHIRQGSFGVLQIVQ